MTRIGRPLICNRSDQRPVLSSLLLPCIAGWRWIRRERWTLAVMGITLLGAATGSDDSALSESPPGASRRYPSPAVTHHGRQYFIDSMTGTGGPYLRISLLIVAAIGGLTIVVWGAGARTSGGTPLYLLAILVLIACLRDPLLLPGTTSRWEVLANATGIRYWFLPSLMFWSAAWCVGRREQVGAVCGTGGSAAHPGRRLSRAEVPTWPASHWSADVARFQSLKQGEHISRFTIPAGDRWNLSNDDDPALGSLGLRESFFQRRSRLAPPRAQRSGCARR